MAESVQTPKLGRHHIVKELGSDGYGLLYQAENSETGQPELLRVIDASISSGENFIVRYQLLKELLPQVKHKNLLEIVELGREGDLFFLAKQWPGDTADTPLQPLTEFDPRNTPNRHRSLESIFEGIAHGLNALNEVKNSYYKDGITHPLLHPDQIYVTMEKALVGGAVKPVPLIDGFAEPFLFFGDEATALLHHRLERVLPNDNETNLWTDEYLYPNTARNGNSPNPLFPLGALIYSMVTGLQARGIFPLLTESDPTLDKRWDKIVDLCLAPHDNPRLALSQVVALFSEMSAARTQLTPEERRLRDVEVPEGMALITFEEKVELGAVDGPDAEQPRFRARLKPFLIDLTPVTCEQFARFAPTHRRSTCSPSNDHPTTLVSWKMADAYCRWRAEQEGLPAGSYRLPTEYEWEAACRGSQGQQYPWGAEPNAHRMHCGQSKEEGALPIKAHPPGRFGLYDMLGNTWEWTNSIFKPHPFSTHEEPGYTSTLYVVKGGCWFTPTDACRGSLRAAFPAHEARGNIGFRCVRVI